MYEPVGMFASPQMAAAALSTQTTNQIGCEAKGGRWLNTKAGSYCEIDGAVASEVIEIKGQAPAQKSFNWKPLAVVAVLGLGGWFLLKKSKKTRAGVEMVGEVL